MTPMALDGQDLSINGEPALYRALARLVVTVNRLENQLLTAEKDLGKRLEALEYVVSEELVRSGEPGIARPTGCAGLPQNDATPATMDAGDDVWERRPAWAM